MKTFFYFLIGLILTLNVGTLFATTYSVPGVVVDTYSDNAIPVTYSVDERNHNVTVSATGPERPLTEEEKFYYTKKMGISFGGYFCLFGLMMANYSTTSISVGISWAYTTLAKKITGKDVSADPIFVCGYLAWLATAATIAPISALTGFLIGAPIGFTVDTGHYLYKSLRDIGKTIIHPTSTFSFI